MAIFFSAVRKPAQRAPPDRHPAQGSRQHVRQQRQSANQIELLKHKADTASNFADIASHNAVRFAPRRPSTLTSPEPRSPTVSPARLRSSVDLPDPEAPIRATICPGSICKPYIAERFASRAEGLIQIGDLNDR